MLMRRYLPFLSSRPLPPSFSANSASISLRWFFSRYTIPLKFEEIIPSNFSGIVYLLKNHRKLIDAEFALNEGGSGLLDRNGKYLRMSIQAGEKVFQTYQLEVTNPGGHSSLPAKDNAITHLAGGLARLGAHDFPFRLSHTTRAYFEQIGRAHV